MSISSINSTMAALVSTIAASDGSNAAVEAAGSQKTDTPEQTNGGTAAAAAPASAGTSSSNASNMAKLRMLASRHLTASQIAAQLGISVSAVIQEAAAAGIHLSTGSSSGASGATAGNHAVGNNINVKA